MSTSTDGLVRGAGGQWRRRRPDPFDRSWQGAYGDTERAYSDLDADDRIDVERQGSGETLSDLERRVFSEALRTGEGYVDPADLVGPQELAALLEVKVATVWQWKSQRELLPEPLLTRSGVPLWAWAPGQPIYEWAKSTGRLTDEGISPQEVARLLGVKPTTVLTWRRRNMMPAQPWTREAIQQWAIRTGRQLGGEGEA